MYKANFWQKIKFPIASFITGYVLMAIELISTRIVAPFVGLSVYTWTSVIGITLLGLAIGNYLGGALADKINAKKALTYCLISAAVFIALIPSLTKFIPSIVLLAASLIVKIVIISLFLFLMPAVFLGTAYPLLLKLYSKTLETIGEKAGGLSASWSLGSILGTFLTGFYFTGFLGSTRTLYLLALCLILFLFLINGLGSIKKFLLGALSLIMLWLILTGNNEKISNPNHFQKFETESNYYKIRVVDNQNEQWGKFRALFLDFDVHSLESLENRNLNIYTEIHPLFRVFKDNITKIYAIGGGAYTLAKNLAKEYPNSEIIVSEIDPKVTNAAINFFKLGDYPRIKTVFEDGRVFLNRDSQKYDLIFGDAYNSFISVPWHLATYEFNELTKKRLTDNGIYAVNFISALEGENSLFFKSMLKTFSLTFPNFYIFSYNKNKYESQNIILVGLKSEQKISDCELLGDFLKKYQADIKIDETAIVLKDDFAPVEKLMAPLVRNYFPQYVEFYYSLISQ